MPRFTTRSWRTLLDLLMSVLMLVAAGFVISRSVSPAQSVPQRKPVAVPTSPISLDGAQTRGLDSAKHVMVMFSDFQCPFCARFVREVLPEVERRYVSTERLALAFQHLPLASHTYAMSAAITAECAGQQGRFWEMHDRLFNAASLEETIQRELAVLLGLDIQQFDACASGEQASQVARESSARAGALGINGTPAFLLGLRQRDGRVKVVEAFSGALPLADVSEKLDLLLAKNPA